MNEVSQTLSHATSKATLSAISSLVSVDGHTPSNSQAGLQLDLFGQDHAPVNLSALQESEMESQMSDTYGQSFTDSLKSAGLKLCSENKSQEPKLLATRKQLMDREYGKKYRKRHRAKDLIRHAEFRAEKKGVDFDLLSHLAEIQYRIDAGNCEVTGLPFNLDGGRTWDSPSIDRRNPQLGYTYDNIRIVCHGANSAMGDWGENVMIKMALAIMSRRREKSNTLSKALGMRLQTNLSSRGSPEYNLIWSEQATESGHVYYRLAASARHTSGKGCIGWPTPDASDRRSPNSKQQGVSNVALLAGWVTPQLGDAMHGGQTKRYLQKLHAVRLVDQVLLSGQTPSSSLAETEKRGVLNPALARWLMGFPEEWDSCGVMAMQSSRRSPRSS